MCGPAAKHETSPYGEVSSGQTALSSAMVTQTQLRRLLLQTEMREHTECARVSPASARLQHAETEDRLRGS